jgi:glycosyltransferase involved in cell wall biosynthesis
MLKPIKVLVLGPFPLPITGVSLANQVVVEQLEQHPDYKVDVVNTSFSSFDEKLGSVSFKKIMFYLKFQVFFLKVWRNDILYITPGQTFFGVFKYALYVIVASLLGKQIIQHIHGNFLGKQYQMLTGLKKSMFKYIMSKTDKGIVLSDSLKLNFSAFILEKDIYVLKNFVIDELFLPNKTLESKNYQELRIVYLSNLMEEKGIFDLLEALKILEQQNISYKAKIAGNIAPDNKERAQKYFDVLEHTEYLGVVNVPQKRELFTWSNTFVLPTYYTMEGQPISILEAMATGNLVITTPHAGIPDVFENGVNGYYVVTEQPLTIVDRLEYIANHKEELQTIALHNVKQARNEYPVSKFISNLLVIVSA